MGKRFIVPRSARNYDMDVVSDQTGLLCEDETLTQQQFAEEVNINTLVRRFNVTGELPIDVRRPTFGDFSEVTDFQTAMNAIAEARESFEAMPAEVRREFNNDPQEFLEFTSDDKNLARMRELGLAVPEVVPPVVDPIRVIVEPPEAAPGSGGGDGGVT